MSGNIFRTFFKVLGYAFLAIIAVIALFSGCVWYVYNYMPWEDKKIERAFNERLEEKMAAGEEKIYLKDLTDFEWNKVCYIAEYALEAPDGTKGYGFDFDSYLGRKYGGPYPLRDVCDTDASNALLFVGENGFTRLVAMDRCPEGKLENVSHECFGKDAALQVNEVVHAGRRHKQLAFAEDKNHAY